MKLEKNLIKWIVLVQPLLGVSSKPFSGHHLIIDWEKSVIQLELYVTLICKLHTDGRWCCSQMRLLRTYVNLGPSACKTLTLCQCAKAALYLFNIFIKDSNLQQISRQDSPRVAAALETLLAVYVIEP